MPLATSRFQIQPPQLILTLGEYWSLKAAPGFASAALTKKYLPLDLMIERSYEVLQKFAFERVLIQPQKGKGKW
jgi:hypothetical protein